MRPELPLTPSRPHAAPLAPNMKVDKKTGPVVMRGNGEAITEAEFVAFSENAPEQNRQFLISTPEGRNLLATEVVKLKMLEQEAERLGITKDAEVQTQLSMLRAQVVASRTLQKLVED